MQVLSNLDFFSFFANYNPKVFNLHVPIKSAPVPACFITFGEHTRLVGSVHCLVVQFRASGVYMIKLIKDFGFQPTKTFQWCIS